MLEKGIRFYAGAPLRTSAGLVLGSLCVIDMEPREFSDEERVSLQNMADDLMAELENGSAKDEQGTSKGFQTSVSPEAEAGCIFLNIIRSNGVVPRSPG